MSWRVGDSYRCLFRSRVAEYGARYAQVVALHTYVTAVIEAEVGCLICEGPHLDKDCPFNEEVKKVKEVVYGEFRRTTPFEKKNEGKFHVGPPGYYTKIDKRPPYGKKRQSLKELLAKHQEESA
ncbi:hypothetical protein Tco_0796221 [Tanacetum coccineum]